MENIALKAFGKKHLRETWRWVNQPELARLTGTVYPIPWAGHLKWFDSLRNDPLRKYFALESRGAHIGNAGIKRLYPDNRCAELFSYIGDPAHRGKGDGTRATELLCRHCFGALGLHRLFVTIFEYNAPALASYAAAGFTREAVLRDHLYRNGRFHNVVLMARIAS